MPIFLDRIDSAPIANTDFDMEFRQWIWVLVDSLNQDISDIQDSFNLLTAQSYTSAEIATMFGAGDLTNGMILYDSTLNEYVGMQSGALVKFTTTPYP